MALVRLENTEDGHAKFWELQPAKNGVNAYWGKINGTPAGPKFYTLEEAEKAKSAKLKKGYRLVA